jgi:methylated-DNA-protein-cysteine methyltransferase related protein
MNERSPVSRYEQIYSIIREIPPGKVASYGQVARILGGVTARMVGYAMAALRAGSDVPWQRVINSQGKISLRGSTGGILQRQILEEEGVEFSTQGRVDLVRFGWNGPGEDLNRI